MELMVVMVVMLAVVLFDVLLEFLLATEGYPTLFTLVGL